MSALMAVMIALIAVLLLRSTALTYRLWKLRQGGTAAILRDIPAVGGHGWRHGVIRYRGGEAGFYRLSSLRWWPDRRLSRRGIEIVSRRAPRGDEFDIMTAEIVVLELRDAGWSVGAGYEMALDRGALTAFLSWFESRPSPRTPRERCRIYSRRRLTARLPQHVAVRIGHPGQDEQQVRQPVEVLGGQRAHAVRMFVDRAPTPTARHGAPPCARRAAAPKAVNRLAGQRN